MLTIILLLLLLLLLICIGLFRRVLLVYGLIISYFLFPRIPIGAITNMQRIDFRIDDIIIFTMCIIAVIYFLKKRNKIFNVYYMNYLCLFILIGLVSSIYNILSGNLGPWISTSFFLKEFEYMILAFILPVFIKDEANLYNIFKVLCLCMFLNILWGGWQLVSGQKGMLLDLTGIPSYGITLIGESQPLQTGFIYCLSFLIFVYVGIHYRKNYTLIFLTVGSFFGILLTLSRTFIISSILLLIIILIINYYSYRKMLFFSGILLVIFYLIEDIKIIAEKINLPIYRLDFSHASNAISNVRWEYIWSPLLSSVIEKPILGHGKGSVGNLLINYDEAHNYFLRILVETGLLGLIAFGLFLFILCYKAIRLYKNDSGKIIYKFVSISVLIIIMLACISSLAQDALYSAKIGIAFYFIIGLMNFLLIKRWKEEAIK